MNLIFDIGNTSTKVAVFDGSKKMTSLRTRLFSADKVEKTLAPYKIDKAIISSSIDIPEFIFDLMTVNVPIVHVLSHRSKLPFINDYQTPETLGTDRIAAAAGACLLFPGEEVLIIDAGSAVTYDYLSGNTYLGGNISPGLAMRFRALHKFTAKLPMVSTAEKYPSIGKNTIEAITAGVINGLIFEINEYIRAFKKNDTGYNIILTGGDSGYLKERINYDVNYMPDIVIDGLNYILEQNADQV